MTIAGLVYHVLGLALLVAGAELLVRGAARLALRFGITPLVVGLLYDIRRPDEWRSTGVVEGSRKLTFVDAGGRQNPEFLPRFTAEVGKNDPVVLICCTGSRTDKLARELMEKQVYTQVYNVRHGITRWIAGTTL